MDKNGISLLLHQRSRLEVLQKVLDEERKILSKMKQEVNSMEEHLLQRRINLTAISNMTEVQNLREENRRLRVECHCLSMEVDFCLKGQAPLGETDEDFYRNIFTGPHGPILPVPNNEGTSSQAASAPTPVDGKEKEEREVWKCSKCTFANHPALNKCEMCEMTRTVDLGGARPSPTRGGGCRGTREVRPVEEARLRPGIGHVQIRLTRNGSAAPAKGLELHLTHRYPRR